MISRRTNIMLRQFYKHLNWNCRPFSSATVRPGEEDPGPLFFNDTVQELLKTMTRTDYKKIFRARKDGKRLAPPTFKFLTDEELNLELASMKKKAEKYMQMPPVVKVREDKEKIISEDYGIEGYCRAKYVFTDISFGVNNRKRLIVVRETNGVLRSADYAERNRLTQIYFPAHQKEIYTPRMFEGEHLAPILERGDYEFILDRACIQFDPDDPVYHRVTSAVYAHINQANKFEVLQSTRHFGPMVFNLAWNDNIDNLLIEMIKSSQIDDAILLLKLYHKIHPNAESAGTENDNEDPIEMIKRYALLVSVKRSSIEKALYAYIELEKEKEKIKEGVKRAHGFDALADESEVDK